MERSNGVQSSSVGNQPACQALNARDQSRQRLECVRLAGAFGFALQRQFRRIAAGARRLRRFTVLSHKPLVGLGCLKRPKRRAPIGESVVVVLEQDIQPEAGQIGSARLPMKAGFRSLLPLLIGFLFLLIAQSAFTAQRFPPPDFEGGHQLPTTATPAPRALTMEYVDLAVLVAGLGIASWLALRRRSRKGVVALSLFSLAYFGFYRAGCLCVIGSIQNVALALGDHSYVLPLFVIGFFALPLLVALFFGRSFCAGVCPHGAIQDLVLIKPVKVPGWVEHALSVVPFVYLGAGVLFAATGSTFLICRYDPFVPLFRLSGSFGILLLGGAFLLLGMFVGRPVLPVSLSLWCAA